jgi:ABC-2 type transport system permease protein
LTRDSLDKTVDVTIPTEASTNTDVDYTGEFFKYLPYVFICMLLTSLGLILGIFREKNLNTRIQCSSMSITKRNLYLTLASISFSLLIWLVFVVISAFVFNDSLFTIHGVLYLVNSLTGILFALSLTYFLSFISTSETVLNMFANIFGLGLSFLGGVFVPLDFLSDGVKNVSRFLPTYWYVLNNDLAEVYTGAAGQLRTFFSYIGIQMLFSVALLLGALALSKIRKNA